MAKTKTIPNFKNHTKRFIILKLFFIYTIEILLKMHNLNIYVYKAYL